jgi:hypothetical protein
MENLIKELIEKVKQQYKDWESFRTKLCSAKENFDDAEKIDQMQKYYYWFTEDSYDRLCDAFKRVNQPEVSIKRMLESDNILLSLYDDCFCVCNEPPNTLYWEGIEELFIIHCNDLLND